MSLLDIRDLRVELPSSRGTVRAVDGADIAAESGEVLGLVGESGCGKTITSLSIMGLLPDRAKISGEIVLDGRDLLSLSKDEMRRARGRDVSMIFQEPTSALNPVLTVGRQICEPLVRAGVPHDEAREAAIEMLETVRVPSPRERMASYPHELSGGLCQRVMIAMALIRRPSLLIADEPTTALDVTVQAQILDLLLATREKAGSTILLITHDLGVVAEVCDSVCVMYAGRVVERGDVYGIFDEPLHPYTRGLLGSLPSSGEDGCDLPCIPGSVPDLADMPPGCPFAPRCGNSMPECAADAPPLVNLSGRHVACWRYAR